MKEQSTEDKKAKLVVQPVPFPGILRAATTTTIELAKQINSMFEVFNDFEGCYLEVAPTTQYPSTSPIPVVVENCNNYNKNNTLFLVLYFKDKVQSGNKFKSVIPYSQAMSNNEDPMNKFKLINASMKNRKYTLNKETKEMLEEFINKNPGSNINWEGEGFIYETLDGVASPFGQQQHITVKVVGLDINKVLKKIYQTDEGKQYSIQVVRPMSQFAGQQSNYMLQITELDANKVNRLASEIGIDRNTPGSINMVRAIK